MTIITTRIHVASDGTISGRAPAELPPGEHDACITIPALPARQDPIEPFDVNALPTHDLGPWPEALSLRREDLYGDDAR